MLDEIVMSVFKQTWPECTICENRSRSVTIKCYTTLTICSTCIDTMQHVIRKDKLYEEKKPKKLE